MKKKENAIWGNIIIIGGKKRIGDGEKKQNWKKSRIAS